MCDFKPGDEVVCINDGWLGRAPRWMFWTRTRPVDGPVKGHHYIVRRVAVGTCEISSRKAVGVELEGPWNHAWRPSNFRKVQRRDLSAWLSTENTIEGPVRAPARAA